MLAIFLLLRVSLICGSWNLEICEIEKMKNVPNNMIVYETRTETKYHREGCHYLNKSCIETTLFRIINQGEVLCGKCRSP